jgi:hypothetical protein
MLTKDEIIAVLETKSNQMKRLCDNIQDVEGDIDDIAPHVASKLDMFAIDAYVLSQELDDVIEDLKKL